MENNLLLVKKAVKALVMGAVAQYGSWPKPDGYRSTGLAAIDAVFSANARYQSVINIIDRIRPILRQNYPTDADLMWFDLVALFSLHDQIAEQYPDQPLAEFLADNLYQNRSVVGGRRKSIVVDALSRRITTSHQRVRGIPGPLVNSSDFDAMFALPNRRILGEQLLTDMQRVGGVGPATARYFLLLLGGPYVKPDVMTRRFVSRAIGREASEEETSRLLETAIDELISEEGWPYTVPQVDHLIWLVESGRLHLTPVSE